MNRRDTRRPRRAPQTLGASLTNFTFRQLQNPFPPYEILGEDQVEQIHLASMRILEEVGLDFLDAETLAILEKAGAKVDHAGKHAWLDRGLVMEAVAHAPQTFTWRARNPAHNVVIGGRHITFGPNGGMVYAENLDAGRHPGLSTDYENFVKLSQVCDVLHYACWEQVTPHDIPVSQRHLYRLATGLTLSDKVVMEAAHGRVIAADNLALVALVFGGLDGDPILGDVINVNSPLRFDDRMLGGLITYARAGQVTFITPFILAGAVSPVTIAGALAQQNAEALAGIALTQLVRPGAPVIYGGFTTNVDMRSGGPAFGTPEGAWALLAGAQLARRYRLPYRGSGGLTNAKVPDAQAAYETMWNLWPAVQAHTNLIMHAAGWMDSGLTASYEKFIIDLENLAMFYHFLAGFPIDDEALALDSIAAVGPGGHHFGTPHTQARFETAFYESALADRGSYDAWERAGREDTAARANRIWKSLLREYQRPPLDPGVKEAIDAYVTRRSEELADTNLYS